MDRLGQCQLCKREVDMPFRCNYCGQLFCDDHRLPENHLCPGLPKERSWSRVSKKAFFQEREENLKPLSPPPYPRQSSYSGASKTSSKLSTKMVFLLVIIGVGFILYVNDPKGFTVTIETLPSTVADYIDEAASETSSTLEETAQQHQESVDLQNQEFYSQVARLVFEYTNDERTKNGLKKLVWDDELAEIARKHSQDMKENGYFSHTNLEGDGPSERAEKAGYNTHKELGGGWYSEGIGENIGKMPTGNVVGHGYVANTPNAIAKAEVESWMNSQGHRENILESKYDRLGVGVTFDGVYYIITQDFW